MEELIFVDRSHREGEVLWGMKDGTTENLIAIFRHCTGYIGGCASHITHRELQLVEPIFLAHGIKILCKPS